MQIVYGAPCLHFAMKTPGFMWVFFATSVGDVFILRK